MSDVGGKVESDAGSPGRAAPLRSLLDRLALDDEVAAAYERLRTRLVTFFRLTFPVEAEALADEAIDRLARRLQDGTPVDHLAGYALGIARLLVLETGTRQRKEDLAARGAMLEAELNVPESEPDPALPALQACLESAGPESARFILEYYAGEGGASRIERRRQLAERAGMTLNALRNRALRLRTALEKCVTARLQAAESPHAVGDIARKIITRDMMKQRPRDEAYD
jgi:DNA-directed RNA polymerase specialized sigma24 family protein